MVAYFLVILAWPICIISLVILLISIYATNEYQDSVQKSIDRYKGFSRAWPVAKSAIAFFITLAYIIAYYNS